MPESNSKCQVKVNGKCIIPTIIKPSDVCKGNVCNKHTNK